jgi:DNA-binding response OmpR family regulator
MSRVLIVDDDPSVRRMLQLTFDEAGFETAVASNGNEALRLASESPFDLVILDIVMPEKEGIETLIELHKSRPDARVIAISGGARFGLTGEVKLDARHALNLAARLGANRCFAKPLDNEELIAVAKELTRPPETPAE